MAQYVVSVFNVLLQLLVECSVYVCFNKLINSVFQTFYRLFFGFFFCLLALSVAKSCVLKSPTLIVELSISLCIMQQPY